MANVYMRQVYFKTIWLQQKGGMYLVLFFSINISWRTYIRKSWKEMKSTKEDRTERYRLLWTH